MKRAPFVALLLLAAAGCQHPEFYALTTPPAGSIAQLVFQDGHYVVRVTEGIALAMSCVDSHRNPCAKTFPQSGDPSIVTAYPAIRDKTVTGRSVSAAEGTIVVVGHRTGTTNLRIFANNESEDLRVEVLPARL